MAACGSIKHIFENPLPENPTLLESLSSSPWKAGIKPLDQQPSFTEFFGELHFQEYSSISHSSSTPSSFPTLKVSRSIGVNSHGNGGNSSNCHKKSDSFSLNSESLQLCTEELGFESSYCVEEVNNEMNQDWESKKTKAPPTTTMENQNGEMKRSRASSGGGFPPPISCIGKSGKPWFCFKSYRQGGRFVLKQVRIPMQEFLHACREDGRLKLQFVQPNDEQVLEGEDFEDDDDDDEDEMINGDIDEEDSEQRQVS